MRNPEVSIGLPVYNGAGSIAITIESILSQEFTDLELIIADNASDDGTEEVCRSFAETDGRVRYTRNDVNMGAAANFNLVASRARGAFFKWSGHDDYYDPGLVAEARAALGSRPDAVLCYWLERMVNDSGETLRAYGADEVFQVFAPDAVTRFRELLWHEKSGFGGDPIYGLIRSDALRRTRMLSAGFQTNWLLMQELSLLGSFHTIERELAVRRYNDVRTTAASLIRWLDPSRKVGFPHFRRAADYFRLVSVSPELRGRERLELYFQLARYFGGARQLKGFLRDLTKGQAEKLSHSTT